MDSLTRKVDELCILIFDSHVTSLSLPNYTCNFVSN